MSEDLLLPEGARLVHIGPPKTGSTSIQVAMAEARAEMAAHGVHYPRGPYRRRKAGWALGLPGAPGGTELPISHWEKLVAEVAEAGPMRVCVSDENFARADGPVVGRIVRDLGGASVHVVAVARPLDRLLPSYWQERVKSGHVRDYETWLRAVLEDADDGEGRSFWQSHDTAALVERWLEFVTPDRFTLVIADEADRLQLPHLFEALLGLPADTLRPVAGRSNVSLTWSELEALRALHGVYADNGWSREDLLPAFPKIVESLRARPDRRVGPRTPPLPAWAATRMREAGDARAEAVAALPVRVIGDPDALRTPELSVETDAVAAEDLCLPVGLVAAVVEGVVRSERQAERQAGRQTGRQAGRPADPAEAASALSGRELLRLAVRKATARLRGR